MRRSDSNAATWRLRSAIAGLGALAAAALAFALVHFTPPAEPVLYAGLELGMNEQQALTAMRTVDAAAYSGVLCTGTVGVGAFVEHLDKSWQLMAHVEGDRVRDVRLYRSSRKNTATSNQCRSYFEETVAPHYHHMHDTAAWQTVDSGTLASDALQIMSTAQVAPELSLILEVQRSARASALCTITVTYTSPERIEIASYAPPQL